MNSNEKYNKNDHKSTTESKLQSGILEYFWTSEIPILAAHESLALKRLVDFLHISAPTDKVFPFLKFKCI